MLESVYMGQRVQGRSNSNVRQALAANLRKNSKMASARIAGNALSNAFETARAKQKEAHVKLQD